MVMSFCEKKRKQQQKTFKRASFALKPLQILDTGSKPVSLIEERPGGGGGGGKRD